MTRQRILTEPKFWLWLTEGVAYGAAAVVLFLL